MKTTTKQQRKEHQQENMVMNQEYIITEEMIRWWKNRCIAEPAHTNTDQCKACAHRGKGARKNCCDFDDTDIEKIFRSRPHSDAPREMVCFECIDRLCPFRDCISKENVLTCPSRITMEEHDAAVAAKVKTEVLDELQRFSNNQTMTIGIHSGWLTGTTLDQKIESLRNKKE